MSVKKTKNDFVAEVAEKAGLTKAEAAKAVDAVFGVLTENLVAKNEVVLPFGKFSTNERAASTGRNPSTGAAIEVPAKTVPKFKAGKALSDAVAA